MTRRHEPTDECDGTPARLPAWLSPRGVETFHACQECAAALCWCEINYGHDCEA